MTLSETQVFGFGENVLKLLQKEKDALHKGGMDMDSVLVLQGTLLEAAVQANAQQHDLKRSAQAATAASVKMTRRLYVTSSGFLDMAIAAVAKDSAAAKEFRKLRSRIGRPSQGPDSLFPEPAPAPAP